MVKNEVNPFYFFPLPKSNLEDYLKDGNLKEVMRTLYYVLTQTFHFDSQQNSALPAEEREEKKTIFARQLDRLKGRGITYPLGEDITVALTTAYDRIKKATPDQLSAWVSSYGTGGSLAGISEDELNAILAGVEERVTQVETEKSDLEKQVQRLTHALGQALQGKGSTIDPQVLQHGRGASTSALEGQVRHLTGQLEMARSLEASLRETIKTLRGDSARYQKKEQRLQTDLTRIRSERNGLRGDVTRLEGNLRTVGGHVAALTKQVNEQHAQIRVYQGAINGTQALLRDAKQVETYLTSAQVALRENRYADARGLFICVLESDPKNSHALEGIIQSLQAQKAPGAEKLNITSTPVCMGSKEILTTLGTVAKNARDYDAAAFFFDRVTVLDGTDVAAHYHLGTIAHTTRDLDAARGHLETVLRLSPKHSSGHYALALVYLDLKNSTQARTHANEAVQLRSAFKDQDLTSARTHRNAGRASQAFVSYERAILFNSQDPATLKTIGDELNTLGVQYKTTNVPCAEQAFRLATQANPQLVHPYYHLGTLAMQQRNYGSAEQYFNLALGLQPAHRDSHRQLSVVYKHLGRTSDAQRHSQLALK